MFTYGNVVLESCARRILASIIPINGFNQKSFLKSSTDVIAIEKSLSAKMKSRFAI